MTNDFGNDDLTAIFTSGISNFLDLLFKVFYMSDRNR